VTVTESAPVKYLSDPQPSFRTGVQTCLDGLAPAILLVEDEPDVASAIRAALSNQRVTHTRDGEEALRIVQRQEFDAVLLDLRMPHMDGFEILRALKANPAISSIPVLVLTGYGTIEEKVCAFELGAHDFITKPFITAELQARIEAATRTKRLHDTLLARTREYEHARDAAELAARNESEFLANMSHEIRTPMNGVIAIAALLSQTSLTLEQREFVETIRTSGESLLTIINDILNISKIQSGKFDLEKRRFSLRECVEAAMDVLAPKAAEKKIDFACELTSDVADAVVGDETRVRQVIINLLSNAVKFTHRGEVILTARRDETSAFVTGQRRALNGGAPDQFIEFSARDSGIGIPSEKLGQLFQPFVQASSSTCREYGGTGLGLAISKGLVELMGGQMRAESAPETGSTFFFTLPLPTNGAAAAGATPAPCPWLRGKRVLLALSNPTIAAIVQRTLQQWEIRCALDGGGAAGETGEFDAVIADQRLSADSAAVNKLLAARLPTVIVSQIGENPMADWWSSLRRQRTVTSPVKPALLRAALQELFGAPTAVKPVTAAPSKTCPGSLPAVALGSRLPLKVLVTDDNVINQKVALRLLQQLGYAADLASNGTEALTAAEKNSYDLIFMDVQMPGMDGLETTRRIREMERATTQCPAKIVAMTANAMMGDRDKCLAAGMDDYLAKPVRPETLQATIERVATTPGPSRSPAPPAVPAPAPSPVQPASLSTDESDGELLDLERLLEFSGGSRTSLIEITDLYFSQTTEQLARLGVAIEQNDAVAVARTAHSSAGSSGVCGILAMEALFRVVEQMGKENRMAEVPPLLEKLCRNFERVKASLLNSRENLPLS